MKPVVRNILAVVIGCVAGGLVNMAIISMSASIIPPPAGADVTTTEGLKASMHLFKPINFLMPWLAHALGTLVAAFISVKFSASHSLRLALIPGVLFLTGGIAAVAMLPSPVWFTLTDLLGAYLPMAWLGYFLGRK